MKAKILIAILVWIITVGIIASFYIAERKSYLEKMQVTGVVSYSNGLLEGRQECYQGDTITDAYLRQNLFVRNNGRYYQAYRTFEIMLSPYQDHYKLYLQRYEDIVYIKEMRYTYEYEMLIKAL